MADPCSLVTIEYKGNWSQTQFTFPFQYLRESDVFVELRDSTGVWNLTTEWTFANATTIKFNTAPPAPTDGLDNIRISRGTDVENMIASFNPGSAIRARDLNDNFEQLQSAIQENKCDVTNPIAASNAITKPQQESGSWVDANDQKLASSDAIIARHDVYVQDTLPAAPTVEQPGKSWQNTDKNWTSYWNPAANAWVAYVNTGPKGEVGPAPGLQDPSTVVTTVPNTPEGNAGQASADVTQDLEGDILFTFGIPQGAKGDQGTPAVFGGLIDITAAPPDPLPDAGTWYIVEPGGTANAGFGSLAGLTVEAGEIVAYTGDAGEPWLRTSTGGGGGGSKVVISDTPPATDDLPEGTLWWNSDSTDMSLYVLYNDPAPDAGKKWVEASPSVAGGGGSGGGVTSIIAGDGISVDQATGDVTITATGGGGGGDQDLQSVTDNGNTTTNGATFGGTVKSETDANTWTAIFKDGAIEGYNNGSQTWFLQSDGRATFAGNVGIGNTNPQRLLQVGNYGTGNGEIALASSISGNCSILMGDGDSGADLYRGYIQYQQGPDDLVFATDAVEKLRIKKDGTAKFVGAIQAGSSSATGIFAGDFRVNADKGSGFGSLYAQNYAAGGRVFIGSSAAGEYTTEIYEDGTADFLSVNYQYGQIVRETTNDNFSIESIGNNNGVKFAFKGNAFKVGSSLTDLNNAANGEIHSINTDGSVILSNYKVVIRDDGNFRMGPSANIDPQTNLVMSWSTGNISTVGTVSASNITTRNATDTGDIDVGERISHLLTRLDAIESNEIIDDATDTSLLQLLANASSRLDSIEARLTALEGGN